MAWETDGWMGGWVWVDARRIHEANPWMCLCPCRILIQVCLGTMTFGMQNTEEEGHQQLDYAIKERGVNFVDTAEMYPVRASRETQGLTEKYVGTW